MEERGLMVGALHEMNPVLTTQGDDNAECLSEDVSVGNQKVLCITGYGPQLGYPQDRRNKTFFGSIWMQR